ncbi:hypothetical protein [Marinigracilibium pacificum]|uniref:Uncharacterized protein n=1 Tax=Marinigracilibium pacificum TaxID=2729599 RepID=A0A848IVB1_9BACT|nr:hypothetical protein [Marinigracilibium pacificum]NMM47626.1 hypothetical protein [Marinigracilibium pacificum]
MKKYTFLLFVVIIYLAFIGCNEDSTEIFINEIELVYPTKIISNNNIIEIIYEGEQISQIIIDKFDSTMNSPFYLNRRDTTFFKYDENSKLINFISVQYEYNGYGIQYESSYNNYLEYNSNDKIIGIYPSDKNYSSTHFTFDSIFRIIQIDYDSNTEGVNKFPKIIKYKNGNLNSYSYIGIYNVSKYDKYSNPYYSVNQILGFPFFNEVYHLSPNNPLRIENLIYPRFSLNLSYEYDLSGKVIKINNTIIEYKD